MNQQFLFILFLCLAASVLALPGKPRHESNPTHESHAFDFSRLQQRQVDRGFNNVYYLANCAGGSKVAFYENMDDSHDPSHQPDITQTAIGSKGRIDASHLMVVWEDNTIKMLEDTSRDFEVHIKKIKWHKEKAAIPAGGGADRDGPLACFKDNGRNLFQAVRGDRCSAFYFCWRKAHAQPVPTEPGEVHE
ncbi:hypothetical protein BU16DRAFT_539733 [Lophium mytilinum]|uniref:Uncharacterized protein n=1 Tax=Lophium mytilinum TaxID=390894 RepID=A0A6A6QQL1_9PEZI|nr:hypothetical protein BU16DRAFT_539733 [Lophium mytilinum]